MSNISYPISLLAGIVSFFSPCVFPLIPSYMSFITGLSFEDLQTCTTDHKRRIRLHTILNSLVFILGFSTVFIAMGASSSYIGSLFIAYQHLIRKAGAVLIIIFGLYIMGILKIGLFNIDKRVHLRGRPAGYIGAFLVGVTFAAGWTPCIGPILGSILLYASTASSAGYGIKLLAVYSLGLAVPFFITSVAFNAMLCAMPKIRRYIRSISIVSGIVMIGFGILLLTDYLYILQYLFPDITINLF